MNIINKLGLQDKYENLLLPDYAKNCIANIPDYIKYLHGINDESVLSDGKRLPRIKKTVLFIIDGFGYKQWHKHQPSSVILNKFAERGSVKSLTSIFPSSTAPAITSLMTGQTTQQHGLIEWLMYDQAGDQIIRPLFFNTLEDSMRESLAGQVDPRVLISSPTLFQNLSDKGVKPYGLSSGKYYKSTYTKLSYDGGEVLPFEDAKQLFSKLNDILLKDERLHASVYWDQIDTASHSFGPDSPECALEVKHFFDSFEKFLKTTDLLTQASDVQILITADHGQIAVEPENVIWLDELTFLADSLDVGKNGKMILPWGLQRDAYLKVKASKLEETIAELKNALHDRAIVFKSQDALKYGLFGSGELHPDFKSRIGNIMILSTGNNTVWYRYSEDEKFDYRGVHGGLSIDEMQIAFAECNLGKLLAS